LNEKRLGTAARISGLEQRLGRQAAWNSGQDQQPGTSAKNSGLEHRLNIVWNKSREQRPGRRNKTAARNIGLRSWKGQSLSWNGDM
jgi:hypothetical protein